MMAKIEVDSNTNKFMIAKIEVNSNTDKFRSILTSNVMMVFTDARGATFVLYTVGNQVIHIWFVNLIEFIGTLYEPCSSSINSVLLLIFLIFCS